MIKTKSYLASRFEMKDMGLATYVLGIKIARDRNEIIIFGSRLLIGEST